MDHELNRRIAIAKHEFNVVSKLWSHSSLTWTRKLRMFTSLIESKLLYSLSGASLTKVQLRRLDGFQNRCLRQITGVKPSWISRISNALVLKKVGHIAASSLLLERQLQQFGKVLRSGLDNPLRTSSFIRGTTHPATEQYVRRVGRPVKEHVAHLSKLASQIFGSLHSATAAAQSKQHWNHMVRTFIRRE